MAFTKESTLKEIMEDPKGLEIIQEYVPDLGKSKHDPMFMMASKMTIENISNLAPDKIPHEKLDEIYEKLAAI